VEDRGLELKYDGLITIATGRSRREMHWSNRDMSWSRLVDRLSRTHRTAETQAEYLAADRTRQDEIKDVGGFVGGRVNGGRRKSENITERSLVTLDIDFAADTGIWEDFRIGFDCAAVMYSTHKHCPDKPRLRLVLPLRRTVLGDEYAAIGRHVADALDINCFDDTTFEPSRLMYWPSTSKDGSYFFSCQDGPWLDPDEVLGRYRNWRDLDEWPRSDRVDKVMRQAIKKQGDPLQKPGILGAFCRTYGIHEAIGQFLAEVYEPCEHIKDRYTYRSGSTTAGLIIYGNRYAYSHHGTDPAGGKLCNAFDLVRLHLYGLQDGDSKEDTPVNRLPSYRAMQELACGDAQVRRQLGIERLREAGEDFAHIINVKSDGGDEGDGRDESMAVEADTEWLGQMDVDARGAYRATVNNVRLILDNDPHLKGVFARDLFEKREIALRDMPWRKTDRRTRYLADVDDAGLRDYVEYKYGISSVQKIRDGLDLTLEKNAFHPVRDYLESLVWDGHNRVETLLTDYLGSADDAYTRAVTRKTLVAAVARVQQPGIKFDCVPVLIGRQGIGKSSLIKRLGRDWHSDSFGTVQGKEAYEQIQGVWLMEMGELEGLKKAEMETIKHYISKQEDRYRVAYGHRVENFPRQCIFIGTTNDWDFLRDPTGNRRFWPVEAGVREPVANLHVHLDDCEVDQIWAEAVVLYEKGEALYMSEELEFSARERQELHLEEDARRGMVAEYLERLLPENWQNMDLPARRNFLAGDPLAARGTVRRRRVCAAEIWCELFGKTQGEITRWNARDIHQIMQNMRGWKRLGNKKNNAKFGFYGEQRGYERDQTIGTKTQIEV
jgi:predicted P-loop ATPase